MHTEADIKYINVCFYSKLEPKYAMAIWLLNQNLPHYKYTINPIKTQIVSTKVLPLQVFKESGVVCVGLTLRK